ncbi:hypothetical protein [Alteromonas gilva]|uniref:Peptidase M1 membrane alanine aminopeptidase domain-containing protein n=1 Tax=Alteromonas gilva TaxID=2987522 RepID=A0ABT5L6T4_9ALTE|nr:hypothetical protein [Alteromonas gilva]MDC8832588.1 hypothetical protein [Alteromonas gilva]
MRNLLTILLLLIPTTVLASDKDYQLHIHVHYQKDSDSWKVNYELPIAVEHVAFSRRSNFDRKKLYQIDESKFKWDQKGDVLLIRSVDGKKFTSLSIHFSSYYDFIQKDYTHNIRYTDGSVLLYTNHLALGANIIEDKSVSPIGASFKGIKFHFYSPNQNIVFLGQSFKDRANWSLEGEGTYIYFGNIQPIENANMIAIVDPALPSWAWDQTQQYFPKLFDYYKAKTGQALNFKPVVFFNYDQVDGDYSNYSGGTLNGLVQLTINGQRWSSENKGKFNKLFHFLAHEAAHFWNGQMFTVEDQKHSWMHEGGADTFANFAMMEFGLMSYEQMVQKFEDAANNCFLNKGDESLEQSAKLWRYRNYYDCGSVMGLASHVAVKAKDSSKTVFDVWKNVFDANIKDRTYSQQEYFVALNNLTKSKELSEAFEKFSSNSNLDNQTEVASWFERSEISTQYTESYSASVIRHWGVQVMRNLMSSHCNKRISFSSYDDFLITYPIEGCKSFEQSMEIQFVDGLEIFNNGINAYSLFKDKCENGETVTLQDREKVTVAELKCLEPVQDLKPYMKLQAQL